MNKATALVLFGIFIQLFPIFIVFLVIWLGGKMIKREEKTQPAAPKPRSTQPQTTPTSELLRTFSILDGFTDVADLENKMTLPLDRLPAAPSVVEAKLTDLLVQLKDPSFRSMIQKEHQDRRYILREDFARLLRISLVHNLPHFVPREESEFINWVDPSRSHDGQPLSTAEIEARMKANSVSHEEMHRAMKMLMALTAKADEIDERLRARGV